MDLGGAAVERDLRRLSMVVGAEPEQCAHRLRQNASRRHRRNKVPARVLRPDEALVDVAQVAKRPFESVPAVGRVLVACPDVERRVEEGPGEMRAHQIVDGLSVQLASRPAPKRHPFRFQVVAAGVGHELVSVKVGRITNLPEDIPDARLAETRSGEGERVDRVGERKFEWVGVRRVEVVRNGKVDEVRRGFAIGSVAGQEVRDARLIRVRGDVAVGDLQSDVQDAVGVKVAAAGKFHVPDFVAVGDAEALEVRGVAVRLAQLDHNVDGLSGGAGALERQPNQRTVIDNVALRGVLPRVGEHGEAAVRRLADDDSELVCVGHDV
mmetsp:Transcript_16820/g.56839  ORF Transcript_16820/g.56839 Transcript_16820/m.56839 type:complete len:324 (+) Transcript_16820:681-1652(+)